MTALVGSIGIRISVDTAGLGPQLRNSISRALASAAPAARSGSNQLGEIIKTGLNGAVVGATAAAMAIGGFGLKAAAAAEQTQIGFEAMLGSAQAAQQMMADLQQFAATTPFEFPGLANAARNLLAIGPAAGIARDQIIPTLSTIGDLGATLGVGQDAIDGVVRALGQMAGKGKLTGEELQQIAESFPGFNAYAAIAAAKGISTAEAMKLVEQGAIGAQEGIQFILAGMREFPGAAGAMQKQAQSLAGVFSTFKDTLSLALTNAFTPVVPDIKAALTAVTPVLQSAIATLGPALAGLLSSVLPVIGQLAEGIVPILAPLFTFLGQGMAAIGPALAPLGQALGQIITALGPLLPLAGQIIATLARGLTPVIVALTPLLDGLVTGLVAAVTPLLPVIVQLAQLLAAILGPAAQMLGQMFAQLGPPIGQLVAALGALIVPLLEPLAKLAPVMLDAYQPLIPALMALVPPIVQLVVALIPIIELVASLLTVVVAIAAPLIKLTAVLVGLLASRAVAPLISLIAQALGWLLSPLSGVAESLGRVGEWLSDIDWAGVGAAIGGAFTTAWQAVAGFFQSIGTWFAELPGKIGTFLAGLPQQLWSLFTDAAAMALQALGMGIGLILYAVTQLPGQILSGLANLPGLLANLFTSAWNSAKLVFSAGVAAVVSYAIGLPDRVSAGLSSLSGRLSAIFRNAVNAGKSAAVSGFNAIVSYIAGIPGRITGYAGRFLSAGSTLIKKLVDGLKRVPSLGSIATAITDIIRSQLNRIIGAINSGIASVDKMLPGSLPRIPLLANGAILRRPTLFVGGEAGDEVVIPLTRPRRARELAEESGLARLLAGGGGPSFTFDKGAIQIAFEGVVPTRQQAIQTGRAIGEGVWQTLARREVATTVRTI